MRKIQNFYLYTYSSFQSVAVKNLKIDKLYRSVLYRIYQYGYYAVNYSNIVIKYIVGSYRYVLKNQIEKASLIEPLTPFF